MQALWTVLIAGMLALYVVLDGFDLGAGIVQFFVGAKERERGLVLRTVGHAWDGNEIWLLAAGATMFFAFPAAFEGAVRGFYAPLLAVAGLLVVRGVALEIRSHLPRPALRTGCDVVFSGASACLAFVIGAGIGAVILGEQVASDPASFWFPAAAGLTAVAMLAAHGSAYVAMKTDGDVQRRARRLSVGFTAAAGLLAAACCAVLTALRPEVMASYASRPWALAVPGLAAVGLGAVLYHRAAGRDAAAFISSATLVLGALGSIGVGLYPALLSSAAAGAGAAAGSARFQILTVGLVWWTIGFVLAGGYTFQLNRAKGAKVTLDEPRRLAAAGD